MIEIVEVDGATPDAERLLLLARSESLHRQLRPKIPAPYGAYLHAMFSEGARLAMLLEDGQPRSLAVWRVHRTTYAGRRFYVDDLVADEAARGRGWGGRLLAWLEDRARALECDTFALDSGVERTTAHRFYFRAGLVIRSFGFGKALTSRF